MAGLFEVRCLDKKDKLTMRVVALVSGGKDSCYNMMKCVAAGHEIVALANLQPEQGLGGKDNFHTCT